ncbi:hypothetical protein DDZ14_09060 [Maritimibacter sp. 55A14]|nr:hypothetical protein DDZ14_09060 [Maritimibacter sp. 55A14]
MIIGREATRVAKDIQIDLQAGRRVKDLGDSKRIAFLSTELMQGDSQSRGVLARHLVLISGRVLFRGFRAQGLHTSSGAL